MGLKLFLRTTRLNFLSASVIPFLTGVSFAHSRGFDIHVIKFLLGFVAVVAAHIAGNVLNDYYDHRTGADNIEIRKSPFFGGSRVLQEGLLRPANILGISAVFFAASFICGISIFFMTMDPVFLLLMLVAGILTVEYTAPPLRLAYRRFGETDIFIMFGVLLVMGSFYLVAGKFTFGSFLISLPVAFLITNVLVCNEIPDFPTDMRTGKRNLICFTGQKGGHLLFVSFLILSLASVAVNIYYGNLPAVSWVVLPVYLTGLKAWKMLKDEPGDLENSIKASRMTISVHALAGLLITIMLLIG